MTPRAYTYAVGQPYLPDGRLPEPRVEYNYRSGQHQILMVLSDLRAREVRDIRQGVAEFALYVEPPLIMLLYRFGDALPWSDAPFSIHRVPAEERRIPEPTDFAEPHDLLQIDLVDADSGIVRGLRAVTFSPAFTARLRLAIIEQAAQPYTEADYDAALADLYRRYPTSETLLAAAVARTVGGA